MFCEHAIVTSVEFSCDNHDIPISVKVAFTKSERFISIKSYFRKQKGHLLPDMDKEFLQSIKCLGIRWNHCLVNIFFV